MGPNGAGKFVFINVSAGLYPADYGTVRFLGRDVTRLPSYALARVGIARTYQNIRLLRRMTVLENVLVAIKDHVNRPLRSLFARDRVRFVRAAMTLLEQFYLADKRDWLGGPPPRGGGGGPPAARGPARTPT